MLFFIAVKRCTKAYYIIYLLCRFTHLDSNTIGFSILWFFCDLLWFFKIALGDNLTGFIKFRGWYRPFHKLGGYVVHPHRWEGDINFFHLDYSSKFWRKVHCKARILKGLVCNSEKWPEPAMLRGSFHHVGGRIWGGVYKKSFRQMSGLQLLFWPILKFGNEIWRNQGCKIQVQKEMRE